MKEYVLYGVKDGAPDWAEEIIHLDRTKAQFPEAQKWASENGYGRFRVAEHDLSDGTLPDFAGTVRV